LTTMKLSVLRYWLTIWPPMLHETQGCENVG
jgi:hypothetical protein